MLCADMLPLSIQAYVCEEDICWDLTERASALSFTYTREVLLWLTGLKNKSAAVKLLESAM